MKNKSKHLDYYVIFKDNNTVAIRKYLSKVEELTGIRSATLSKHFSRSKNPYSYEGFEVYKTRNVDLKSYNKGNSDNLSSSEY